VAALSSRSVVSGILKGSEYALTIFGPKDLDSLEFFEKKGKQSVICAVTGKPRPAKPEEIVRQLYLHKLMGHYGYPRERIALEKPVHFGSSVHEKAADIVVWERDAPTTPYIIVETKKPKRKDGLEQLKSYCNAEGSPIGLWTNGGETIALHREPPDLFRNLSDLPLASQRLSDVLTERWTIDDLRLHNKFVSERRSARLCKGQWA